MTFAEGGIRVRYTGVGVVGCGVVLLPARAVASAATTSTAVAEDAGSASTGAAPETGVAAASSAAGSAGRSVDGAGSAGSRCKLEPSDAATTRRVAAGSGSAAGWEDTGNPTVFVGAAAVIAFVAGGGSALESLASEGCVAVTAATSTAPATGARRGATVSSAAGRALGGGLERRSSSQPCKAATAAASIATASPGRRRFMPAAGRPAAREGACAGGSA